MTEMERIARLLAQSFDGKPYYGPSVMGTLEEVAAPVAARRPRWSAHSMWDIVGHLTAEMIYARQVLEGTAPPYGHTWPAATDITDAAWQRAVAGLRRAHRDLLRAVRKLDDRILDRKPIRARGPYHLMLHGTIAHNAHHAGQLSLLRGQMNDDEPA